jgi:uncharacterized radical SAM protein YgiQ
MPRHLPLATTSDAASLPFEDLCGKPRRFDPRPLPMSAREIEARGWNDVDVVFITGDAYVDHPSFANALLGRLLERAGYRVAILSQPNWTSVDDFRRFGRPRLFFGVSAGNMDSMINHYTANRKRRNDDAYSPGGRVGMRPDRATLAYCQRAREAFPGVPIIAGGIEASLRRIAHYDYWSDTVRRSILLDAKPDVIVFGMGERTLLTLAQRFAAGGSVIDLYDLRGVAYRLGAREVAPDDCLELPSYERVREDPIAFCEMTRLSHRETNPYNARPLVQAHGPEKVVLNPPALPLGEAEMDFVYGLPFTRKPHSAYGGQKIPAYEVIKHSVQIMRGCFGGCTFCSITAHEGRIIQSRSRESVLAEIDRMAQNPEFTGIVSDIGGPTANMYRMRCTRPEVERICRRLSCVHPKVCKLLGSDHGPLIDLMRHARRKPKVRKVFVASGVRMDLARRDSVYMRELIEHHVGGQLKVAPEHTDPNVLGLMKKPGPDEFLKFEREFQRASDAAGKRQRLVPYFIASHPGSDLKAMIDLASFLKRHGHRPDQVQDFIPSPFDIAACMYHTGYDPMTMQPVSVAKHLRDRKLQRALLQFFKPENYLEVRRALLAAGRSDLIGDRKHCLIPSTPPEAALDRRRRLAVADFDEQRSGDHVRSPSVGYRPHRAGASRRSRNSAQRRK